MTGPNFQKDYTYSKDYNVYNKQFSNNWGSLCLPSKRKRVAKEINRDTKVRMLNRLKSFLFLCKKLDMNPKHLLKNSILFPQTAFTHRSSKWFFMSIQKGLLSEVKSMVSKFPELIYQIDKVSSLKLFWRDYK